MISLEGKTALVTGGSRGIGAAVAEMLAKSGAAVAITYATNARRARSVAERIAAHGKESLSLNVDVRDARAIHKAVNTIRSHYRKIDILVLNAGIWKHAAIGTMTEEEWDATVDTNLKGPFLFSKEVVPLMKKRRSGKIITIASTAGQRGEAEYAHYAASKGGLIAFTKSIAVELAPYNINVNCVSPGWVNTDMTASVLRSRTMKREIPKIIPRGKVATPEDIAGAVLFLASDLSDHIVGAVINVNGGGVLYG